VTYSPWRELGVDNEYVLSRDTSGVHVHVEVWHITVRKYSNAVGSISYCHNPGVWPRSIQLLVLACTVQKTVEPPPMMSTRGASPVNSARIPSFAATLRPTWK